MAPCSRRTPWPKENKLNITTTLQNGTKQAAVQLHDIRGNTVTTVDLDTETATAWSSYDEYGNPDTTNPANTNNINYTTYAQAERATNTTGLILMGARVYNPTTNQFTTPDPVKGGNENPYTYPNDPLNSSDYSGLESATWEAIRRAILNLILDVRDANLVFRAFQSAPAGRSRIEGFTLRAFVIAGVAVAVVHNKFSQLHKLRLYKAGETGGHLKIAGAVGTHAIIRFPYIKRSGVSKGKLEGNLELIIPHGEKKNLYVGITSRSATGIGFSGFGGLFCDSLNK